MSEGKKMYEGDGNLERIDPTRLTIGNVVRMSYRDGGFTPFNDCVVLGIRVDLSTRRRDKGLQPHIHCETLAAAMKEAQPGDYVIVILGRPYMYADNPFASMPNAMMGYEKYEVYGDRIQDTHKVIVNSKGEYHSYMSSPLLASWEVIAGAAIVYKDLNEAAARATYKAYKDMHHSANITLFRNGEVVEEHNP